MAKILLTAFEPFGITGKYLRGKNSSAEIMDGIESKYPNQYDRLILPVSDQAEIALQNHIKNNAPSGVVCMGEHLMLLPGTVRVEPFAHDHPVTAWPHLKMMTKPIVPSKFVQECFPEQNASSIQRYFCNRVYLAALQLSERGGHFPVAFLHVSVLGNRELQMGKVTNILNKMEGTLQKKIEVVPSRTELQSRCATSQKPPI